ncbi:N(1)-aminopropylagmatine ureohydrolase [uncultured archaeon]|nr:N(1)-aminopropylagmatine ureohydrolase [uncultured archaeon]
MALEIFHTGLPRTFLGVPNDYDKSKYAVLSDPYDSTASYGVGMRFGPHAIIEASRQVETYDIELGRNFETAGIYTCDELEVHRGSPEKNCLYVQEAVEAVLKEKRIPILLGGEHSVSVGAFNAFAAAGKAKDISVLQIDAHADMRQEYEGTPYNHACVMRRCREKFHAVSVGIRSHTEEEAEAIAKGKLDIFGVDFKAEEVVKKLKENVYVTIDLDGFDPSECPAVGTPEPGGLRWKQVCELLRLVASKRKVVGFDVVELCPIPGNTVSDFLAARLVYKIIGYIETGKK